MDQRDEKKKADIKEPTDSHEKPSRKIRALKAVFRPKILSVLASLVAVAITWPILKSHLPDLSKESTYLVTARDIEVNPPPHWVPHHFIDDLVARVGFPTNDVAKRFAQHPWVAEVKEVRKASFPPRLMVMLAYRRPVAMIEKRTGLYPVDVHGVLLPKEDFSLSDTADYATISGVRSSPPSVQGEVWNDPAVKGAARLAAVLRTHRQRFHLKAILVPPRVKNTVKLADLEFKLLTTSGSTILWGRAPGVEHDEELSIDQKIDRLKTYLADYGSFDAPAGPYEIDIRDWQQISRRQIPAARDANLPKESF